MQTNQNIVYHIKKIDATYSRLKKLTCPLEANNNACSFSSIIEQIIIKTVSHILNNKHPYPLYNLFKIHLSNRTTNRFLLYKKPIKRLTFLYNILELFNSSNYQRWLLIIITSIMLLFIIKIHSFIQLHRLLFYFILLNVITLWNYSL